MTQGAACCPFLKTARAAMAHGSLACWCACLRRMCRSFGRIASSSRVHAVRSSAVPEVHCDDPRQRFVGCVRKRGGAVVNVPEWCAHLREVEQRHRDSVRRRQQLGPGELTGLPPELWVPYRGIWLRPAFAPDHPVSPPHIYLQPHIKSPYFRVHPGESTPRLAWCSPGLWHPGMRLLDAVTGAMRFLDAWRAGLIP